jgi:hypothetical protein
MKVYLEKKLLLGQTRDQVRIYLRYVASQTKKMSGFSGFINKVKPLVIEKIDTLPFASR